MIGAVLAAEERRQNLADLDVALWQWGVLLAIIVALLLVVKFVVLYALGLDTTGDPILSESERVHLDARETGHDTERVDVRRLALVGAHAGRGGEHLAAALLERLEEGLHAQREVPFSRLASWHLRHTVAIAVRGTRIGASRHLIPVIQAITVGIEFLRVGAVVDQDLAHGAGCNAKEMRSALPVYLCVVYEFQVGFMDQGCGVKRRVSIPPLVMCKPS